MDRVTRYEAAMAEAAIDTVEADLNDLAPVGGGNPLDPSDDRESSETDEATLNLLEALADMPDKEPIHKHHAGAALRALAEALPEHAEAISVPGVPDDDAEFDAFDRWTAGLIRKAIAAYAAGANITAEDLLAACAAETAARRDAAQNRATTLGEKEQRWEMLVEQEKRRRVLLRPDALNSVTRYESYLQKSFYQTLHEIERLQAARAGRDVPLPEAIDVNVTLETADSKPSELLTPDSRPNSRVQDPTKRRNGIELSLPERTCYSAQKCETEPLPGDSLRLHPNVEMCSGQRSPIIEFCETNPFHANETARPAQRSLMIEYCETNPTAAKSYQDVEQSAEKTTVPQDD